MKFYFLNSYDQSLVGFQLAHIATGEQALQFAKVNRCDTPELQSALFNSGAVCLAGKSADETDYFLLRKISITDPEGRAWYINMAVEARPIECGKFCALVKAILLNHEEFLKTLSVCFHVREGELSYRLDAERFWAYVSSTWQNQAVRYEFYRSDNPFADKLLGVTFVLTTQEAQEIVLLVPESTLTYFTNQNPIFRNRKILYSLSCQAFEYLLAKDPAIYTLEEETPTEQTKRKVELPDEAQKKLTQIAAGLGIALVMYGGYKLMSDLFGKETNK